ncbi:MAG: hypothetical protein HY691_15120 [Chloroflexi bacterium]|nr:hypothetical protein [Chloroflexota bacterium]
MVSPRLPAHVGNVLLAALVLDVLSWPPLLVGAWLAESVAAPGFASGELPTLFWPALLIGQYVGWVAVVAMADIATSGRRAPRH